MRKNISIAAFLLITNYFAGAQENYEIQVYGSQTMAPKITMVELHSNYTLAGSKSEAGGIYPSNHILHETIEITHGFNDWFETGFYLFNAIGSEGRTSYVGSHIRPRVRVPETWHWPVGVSLSAEVGYQKLQYSEDDWSIEIRPIIDKTLGSWYFSFNPTFEKALHGASQSEGFIFSPNLKTSYGVSSVWNFGFEYYGSVGGLFRFFPSQEQEHELFAAADVNFSPKWELNFGYGISLNRAIDNSIAKVILGYRIGK